MVAIPKPTTQKLLEFFAEFLHVQSNLIQSNFEGPAEHGVRFIRSGRHETANRRYPCQRGKKQPQNAFVDNEPWFG